MKSNYLILMVGYMVGVVLLMLRVAWVTSPSSRQSGYPHEGHQNQHNQHNQQENQQENQHHQVDQFLEG